jgi:hypothetical protein
MAHPAFQKYKSLGVAKATKRLILYYAYQRVKANEILKHPPELSSTREAMYKLPAKLPVAFNGNGASLPPDDPSE